jgi:hypothetical protein
LFARACTFSSQVKKLKRKEEILKKKIALCIFVVLLLVGAFWAGGNFSDQPDQKVVISTNAEGNQDLEESPLVIAKFDGREQNFVNKNKTGTLRISGSLY